MRPQRGRRNQKIRSIAALRDQPSPLFWILDLEMLDHLLDRGLAIRLPRRATNVLSLFRRAKRILDGGTAQ
jgi:hypothetical protein